MNVKSILNKTKSTFNQTFRIVNRLPETERITAIVLMFIPMVLSIVDNGQLWNLRPSISNYAYMNQSYWFGSLLALAGALFIFNGAQHMKSRDFKMKLMQEQNFSLQTIASMQDDFDNPDRFGKGYNIIFGIALFGVIYFDHLTYVIMHYAMALIFYGGCIIMMIFKPRPQIKKWGQVLGTLTLLALVFHFVLEYWILVDKNWYTLLWAEWIGLIFIGIYFIKDSLCYSPIKN
ncbi:hypothetical protein [Winogradskyella sp.]|uniref:DUF7103 family protein n=1 Tax=Winogradskyella sp. TaxID=1883156 RepID=UPI00260F52E3|nr:hypothetical protein [Winogradskyella sp.]